MKTVTNHRDGKTGLARLAAAAAVLCLCPIPSCTYKEAFDSVPPVREIEEEQRCELEFSAVFAGRSGNGLDVAVTLASEEPAGMYGVVAVLSAEDGECVSVTEGEILLVPGTSRTISLPIDREGKGRRIGCVLTAADGRTSSADRVVLDEDALSYEPAVLTRPALPETMEMQTGKTSVLLPDVLPGGSVRDLIVESEGAIEVSVDDFGANITPLVNGHSIVTFKAGDIISKISVLAVSGTPSSTVTLPGNVVLPLDAETALVAAATPYGTAATDCQWSVDKEGIVSLKNEGTTALLHGLAEGTARVTFSSSLGTAVTTVTVIGSKPLPRVTSVSLPERLYLKKGESVPVNATYEPADAVLGRITWSVSGSEDEIISLEAFELSGTIKGLHDGDAVVTVDIDGVRCPVAVNVSPDGQEPPVSEPTGDVEMPERIVMLSGSENTVSAIFKDGAKPQEGTWKTTPAGYLEILREDCSTVFLKALKEGQTDLVFTSGNSVGVTHVNIISSSSEPVGPGTTLESVLLPTSVDVTEGEEKTLTAVLSPSSYVLGEITWTLAPDDDAPVSLSWAGTTAKLKARKPGTATVTVTVDGKKASAAITVLAKPAELESVSIETKGVESLKVGESAVFTGSCNPVNYIPTAVEWSASPEGIVTLVPNGTTVEVKGTAAGTAEVVFFADGKKATASVTVEKAAELQSVSIDAEEMKGLKVGESVDVTGSYSPDDYTPASMDWSASPEGIVSLVPDGTKVKVTATAPGTAELTFTVDGKTASVSVTVVKAVELESVSIETKGVKSLKVGESAVFTGSCSPDNYIADSIGWSVSPEGVVTAVPDGTSVTLTAAAPGTAEVKLTVDGKTATASVVVEEPVKLESVDMYVYPTERTLMVGQRAYLTGSCSPENYIPSDISWSASPEGIVSIVTEEMEAIVTGTSPGNVDITFTVDGKTKTERFSIETARPAYVPSLTGNEFYEGQNVSLSFTGSPIREMETVVKLDGNSVLFFKDGINTKNIPAGEHVYTVEQKFGSYVVDSKEMPFTVYPSPAPVISVSRGGETETFSSYVCLRKGENVRIDISSSEKEDISIGNLTECSNILTPTGQTYLCYRTGESSLKWSADRGAAHMEGTVPIVVYDVITAKVSAYTKKLSVESCYVTMEVTDNSYGSVSASSVTVEPHYRIPLPNGKEVKFVGKRINAGSIDLSAGAKHEWSVSADAEQCQKLLSAEGYDLSDVTSIYISLKLSGTLSERYLILEGYNGGLTDMLTGSNSIIREYFLK